MQRYQSGGDRFSMESRNVRGDVIDETIENFATGCTEMQFRLVKLLCRNVETVCDESTHLESYLCMLVPRY